MNSKINLIRTKANNEQDELNQYDIMLGDLYVLNYYGVLVFFEVCKTRTKSVFLVELKSEEYLDGTMISRKIQASKDPLVITQNNTYRKSTYEVYPVEMEKGEYWLPIKVDYGSKLFKKASECCVFPLSGYHYAVPMKDAYDKYFKKDIKNIKNSA